MSFMRDLNRQQLKRFILMHLKEIKRSCKLLLTLVVLVFIAIGCSKKLPKEEAEKQLKAFDNELIILYDQISKSEGVRILNQLLSIDSLPVPLMNLVQSNVLASSLFCFEEHTGFYTVENKTATWKSPSDSIIVEFPFWFKSDSVAYLELSQYTEKLTRWGSLMPTSLNLKLKASGVTLVEMNLRGEVKHDIPTKMDMEIKMDNYLIKSKLRSILNKRKARFYIDLEVSKAGKNIVSLDAFMRHNVTNPDQAILEKTKVKWRTFPLDVHIQVDNKSFNPATNNFIEEFNQHTTIQVKSQINGALLGEVELKDRQELGKLNYAITFNDGTFEFLEEFMLANKYLMNARYPDVPVSRK